MCTNIYLLKLLADLEKIFLKEYFRSADRSNILVSEVFAASNSFATKVGSMETPSADEFCDTLRFNQNGDLEATLKIKGNIIFDGHSRQSRGQNQGLVLKDIKSTLNRSEEKVA